MNISFLFSASIYLLVYLFAFISIHFDLKPGNIVLDANGMVKITDFGLSKVLEAGNAEASEIELTSQGTWLICTCLYTYEFIVYIIF
jgi:serine/threonine protein kinase